MRSLHPCAAAVALSLASAALPAAHAVEIAREGASWRVAAETYKAEVTVEGHFRSLVVDGVELLAEREYKKQPWVGGDFPGGKPAASVVRNGHALIASRDAISVRYEFGEKGFHVQTKGGAVRWLLSDNVNACISTDGVIPPSGARGDVYRLVAGRAAVAVDQPHHVVFGRMFPSRLTRGGKPEEPFEARWTCGVKVAPEEQVDLAALDPAEGNPKLTAEYEAGDTPRLRATLKSLARAPARLSVAWTVHDHPHDGEQVHAGIEMVTLAPGGEEQLELEVPVTEPGLYWVRADLLGAGGETDPAGERGKPMQSRTRGFIYDRDNYRPPLTRPDDFAAFWARKLETMRRIPFEPKLARNDAHAIEGYEGYDLTINGHDGQRLGCVLV
ncbi:MAG: acetylxylan esterase, partial [Planctomycetota bacterium]